MLLLEGNVERARRRPVKILISRLDYLRVDRYELTVECKLTSAERYNHV